jgi:hypothetical protein
MRYFLLLFLCPSLCFGQEICGTTYDSLFIDFPEFRVSTEWKTIDVVVHICYSDSFPGSYLDSSYVEEAISLLGDDMSESMIEINLAGITYKDLSDYAWHDMFFTSETFCFPNWGTHNTILAIDIQWDRSLYCNIYILPDMCGTILGWSYATNHPHNSRDGIWIKNTAFGIGSEFLLSTHNLNKVITHEMGHYCGLYHVFQSASNCGDNDDLPCDVWGDFVCDTPPTKVQWSCDPPMCPEALYNYTADNHMDYYPDVCREHFTSGQIERMHNMLEYQRASLFGGDVFCFGDVNGDLIIGSGDLIWLLTCYGIPGCLVGDVNGSGLVNVYDLNFVLSHYGQICEGHALYE